VQLQDQAERQPQETLSTLSLILLREEGRVGVGGGRVGVGGGRVGVGGGDKEI
jgi:hypothetical protein